MKVFLGTDLGSTTTKAVLMDEAGEVLGRGITNSRSNYELAAHIARDEAFVGARFTLLERNLRDGREAETAKFEKQVKRAFRRQQHLAQLEALREQALAIVDGPRYAKEKAELRPVLEDIFAEMEATAKKPALVVGQQTSEFFRDRAASQFSSLAERSKSKRVPFERLMGVYDKAILEVEGTRFEIGFAQMIDASVDHVLQGEPEERARFYRGAVNDAKNTELDVVESIGTGYGRQTLPFPKSSIRSEILCHGLGAHMMFPKTATVLDIGGQDTKAIQVDDRGIVTSFQMNDRCAAGCGRYLGYIADEMSLGVHELGPLALESTRHVKINSTCTVFAGAELRDRLTMGQRREDILAGLHRAIILRAMALLARSGGVADEFTFTGGVANNPAAVKALKQLVQENYGERVLNISPSSIYTGAIGAALFGKRAFENAQQEVPS